jgi:hypothetical protein
MRTGRELLQLHHNHIPLQDTEIMTDLLGKHYYQIRALTNYIALIAFDADYRL